MGVVRKGSLEDVRLTRNKTTSIDFLIQTRKHDFTKQTGNACISLPDSPLRSRDKVQRSNLRSRDKFQGSNLSSRVQVQRSKEKRRQGGQRRLRWTSPQEQPKGGE